MYLQFEPPLLFPHPVADLFDLVLFHHLGSIPPYAYSAPVGELSGGDKWNSADIWMDQSADGLQRVSYIHTLSLSMCHDTTSQCTHTQAVSV